MPNVLLPVPHFEQSHDGFCLPPCEQMVLSHLGDERTEAELSKLLGTKAYGPPIRNAEKLRKYGYGVDVRVPKTSSLPGCRGRGYLLVDVLIIIV